MTDNPTTTAVVCIYRFPALPKAMLARISAGRSEAARVWMHCRDLHHAARRDKTPWPRRDALQKATKGRFALHSQTVQMIGHAFLANIDTTCQNHKAGDRKAKYPWRDKRYYPLLWPAQAVGVQGNYIILPMGRNQPSIVLPKPEGFVPGGCKLVWNGIANELHVTVSAPAQAPSAATGKATVDLGQIHQAAVTASTGPALIVSGRGQRSLKRRNNKRLGKGFCQALYARIAGLNLDAARQLASAVMAFAARHGATAVVIEDLKGWRPTGRGGQRKRFHRFQHRYLVKYLTYRCEERGLRLLSVYARGTSYYAYDGSGPVKRDKKNACLATFSNGRRYNADLNGAQNIAARGLAILLGLKPHKEVSGVAREGSPGRTGKSSGRPTRIPLVLADIWAHARMAAGHTVTATGVSLDAPTTARSA